MKNSSATGKSGNNVIAINTQKAPKVFLSIWEKSRLLEKVTQECTSIYPAKLDKRYVSNLRNKVNGFIYTLTTGFNESHFDIAVIPYLLKYISDLNLLWKDGYVKGFSPLTEKQIIVQLLKDIKSDIMELRKITNLQTAI
jgi:hypothetical protein